MIAIRNAVARTEIVIIDGKMSMTTTKPVTAGHWRKASRRTKIDVWVCVKLELKVGPHGEDVCEENEER